MKGKTFGTYLIFLLIPLAVGGLGALVTSAGMPAYEQLNKPFFTPPSLLFPIVWGILYVLMGIGGARVWLSPWNPRIADAENRATHLQGLVL